MSQARVEEFEQYIKYEFMCEIVLNLVGVLVLVLVLVFVLVL